MFVCVCLLCSGAADNTIGIGDNWPTAWFQQFCRIRTIQYFETNVSDATARIRFRLCKQSPQQPHIQYYSAVQNSPEHACGGSGKMSVVELLRRATAQPSDCGLKLRSCCIKSEHSIRATSAKCRSHRIWFCARDKHSGLGRRRAVISAVAGCSWSVRWKWWLP